jgi:hypothetical protein
MSTSIYMDIRTHMITSMNTPMVIRNTATGISINTPTSTFMNICMSISIWGTHTFMTMNIREITVSMSTIIRSMMLRFTIIPTPKRRNEEATG